jgi:hypothetical protein
MGPDHVSERGPLAKALSVLVLFVIHRVIRIGECHDEAADGQIGKAVDDHEEQAELLGLLPGEAPQCGDAQRGYTQHERPEAERVVDVLRGGSVLVHDIRSRK